MLCVHTGSLESKGEESLSLQVILAKKREGLLVAVLFLCCCDNTVNFWCSLGSSPAVHSKFVRLCGPWSDLNVWNELLSYEVFWFSMLCQIPSPIPAAFKITRSITLKKDGRVSGPMMLIISTIHTVKHDINLSLKIITSPAGIG